MEPFRSDAPRPEPPARQELRALTVLRDRVEAAAREIERLRAENAALAARVAELQTTAGSGEGDAFRALVAEGEDVEALKARIQGFIAAIDQVINPTDDAPARRDA